MTFEIGWREVGRRTWGVLGFWMAFVAVLSQQYAVSSVYGSWQGWLDGAVTVLLAFLPWLPISVLLLFAAVRLPLLDYRPVRNFLLLLAAAAAAAVMRIAVYTALQGTGVTLSAPEPLTWSRFASNVMTSFHRDLLNAAFFTACFTAHEVYRIAAERRRSAAELQARVAEAELRYLRMQLNPHFLFNALNAVTTLIAVKPRAAEQTLLHLSDLLRRALDNSETQLVPIAREIDFLERYLAIQHVRFGEQLRTEIEVEPEVCDVPIPGMILQPLVENAIRHSVATRGAGSISVTARGEGDEVRVCVRDDGPGLRHGHAEEGIGIANVRARLEHLFGSRAGIRILNVPGAFTVEIRLPGAAA